MARARSQSPGRSRSRTPARQPAVKAKKSQAEVDAAAEADTNTAIAIGVLAVVWYCSGNALTPVGFVNGVTSGFSLNFPNLGPLDGIVRLFCGTGFAFLPLMHILNTLSDNATTRGYWYNNFAQALIACFGANILQKVLDGDNMVKAVFSDPPVPGMSLFGVFLIWYVINHDIPACPHVFNIWDTILETGGDALQLLLSFGSEMWVTGIVIKAVGSPSAAFSTAWFQAIALGVVYGTAGSFFPLNKGFQLARSDEATHAFAVAAFLASNGFAIIDVFINTGLKFVTEFTFGNVVVPDVAIGAKVNEILCAPLGGLVGFVIIVTSLNHFFGGYLPIKAKSGFDGFRCSEKTLELFQLK